jgi:hypothetical protein
MSRGTCEKLCESDQLDSFGSAQREREQGREPGHALSDAQEAGGSAGIADLSKDSNPRPDTPTDVADVLPKAVENMREGVCLLARAARQGVTDARIAESL